MPWIAQRTARVWRNVNFIINSSVLNKKCGTLNISPTPSACMTDVSLFSHEQIVGLLAALPDPAFIFTRSGRYAALFGGADNRYYHDGSSLVGKTIADVLSDERAEW